MSASKRCRPGVETWIQAPGRNLDQNVLAGYATVVLASILDPSGGLPSDAARGASSPAWPEAPSAEDPVKSVSERHP